MEPLEFQTTAAKSIQDQLELTCNRNNKSMIMLQAPTGAGKTLIVTEAIRPILHRAAFIWLSYYPSVNSQSLNKLESYGIPANNLDEISADSGIGHLERGTIYFLNFQKLGREKRLEVGGDTVTAFSDLLKNAAAQGLPVIAIVDEAHFGSASRKEGEASTLLEEIISSNDYPFSGFLGVTATPAKFQKLVSKIKTNNPQAIGSVIPVEVGWDEPKKERLLKNKIRVDHADKVNAHEYAATICKEGLRLFKKIKEDWKSHSPDFCPLLIVQVPDKFDEENTQFQSQFQLIYSEIMEETLDASSMRHCFSGKSAWEIEAIPPEDIQEMVHVKVVFFKSALTAGWDCPRAEMLISIRSAKDETSIIQLVGRMLRNPNGLTENREDMPDLDTAFLFLPNYDPLILEKLRLEYNKVLGEDGVESSSEVVHLTWNPTFLEYKKDIEEIFSKLQTAKKIWKGKNLPSRIKEFTRELEHAGLKKTETSPFVAELTDWLKSLEEKILEIAESRVNKSNGDFVTITTTVDEVHTQRTVAADTRDESRSYRELKKESRRSRDGVTEDILSEVNHLLKEKTGIPYPILQLHKQGILGDIISSSTEACQESLKEKVSIIVRILQQHGGSARGRLVKIARGLVNLDTTLNYQDWTVPSFQTAKKEQDWVTSKKAIHIWDNKLPKGSNPEHISVTELENDPNVICFVRNPQKGSGLGIKYDFEEEKKITYPDYVVLKGKLEDKTSWSLQILESKGGENRPPDKGKYKAQKEYANELSAGGFEVDTKWLEVEDGITYTADPQTTKYADRTQRNSGQRSLF